MVTAPADICLVRTCQTGVLVALYAVAEQQDNPPSTEETVMPSTPKTRTGRTRRVLLRLTFGALALIAVVATVGTLTTTNVVTVTRTTTASADAIWNLWADVPNRTRWDSDLEWARINGPFQHGATGHVKLNDQPARAFEIIECEPTSRYTDRFFLPLGTSMDWHHTITELGDGRREVTFRVEVTGPIALTVALIAGNILNDDLPAAVEQLTTLAERAH